MVMENNPLAGGQVDQIREMQDEEKRTQEDINAMLKHKQQILETQNAMKEQNRRLKKDLMTNDKKGPRRDKPKKKKKKEENSAFGQKRVLHSQQTMVHTPSHKKNDSLNF